MTPLINVRELHFYYSNYVTALEGINLGIEKGEFVAIMGENGAGKTTLVKHFNGLLKPTRGKVTVDGVDTREVTVAELSRKVGYVFQNPLYQLFCETVEKEVALGLRYSKISKKEKDNLVSQTLKELDIDRYMKRHPLMLSEGERKSVALASVLVMDPQILILDEPTLAQDALEKSRLQKILTQLNENGRTIILVSHDVEFVFDTADRVITMCDGKILADGAKKDVVTKTELFREAGLVEPQLVTFASAMCEFGLKKEMLTIEEACNALIPLLKRERTI